MLNQHLHNISNGNLSCTICEIGAEIVSLKSMKTECEYLWQNDTNVWSGSAPILFPIVGRLNTGKYTIEGKEYTLPTHGFARSEHFKVKQQCESSITFSLNENKSTLKVYPFKFQLNVTFTLEEQSLLVTYQVINQDSSALYFAIGSHPAFALPPTEFSEGKCKLLFSEQENNYCCLIKNDLLSDDQHPVALIDKSLVLTPKLFEQDALIFRDINSSTITLAVNEQAILSVDTGNNKHLGLWAKPNSPYACIEPWISTDETGKTPLELKDKPDLTCLLAGEKTENNYRINILNN